MQLQRLEWIDITKGFAIILMVFGHSSIPKSISNYIWSFHMPLFFIISGFLYNASKYKSPLSLIKKRYYTLIIPDIFFSIFAFVGMYPLGLVKWEELYKGWEGYALWFIPVLFTTEILFNYLLFIQSKFSNSKYYLLESIILILSIVGFILSKLDSHYIFKLEVTFFAIFFYSIGFIFKRFLQNIFYTKKIIFLSLLLQIIVAQFIPTIDMASNQFGYFIPNIIIAIWGTINVILMAKHIALWNNRNIIKYLFIWAGKNTLIIMGLSQVINMIIKSILTTTHLPATTSSIIQHCLLWITIYICSIIFNKYTPFLIGKKTHNFYN